MRTVCALVTSFVVCAAATAIEVSLQVTNPMDSDRPHAAVVAPASLLGDAIAPGSMTARLAHGQTIPAQADDLDGDGVADEIAMVLDLRSAEAITVTIDTAAAWEGESLADARIGWRYENYAVLDTDRIAYGLYGVFSSHFVGGLQWDCYGKRPEAWKLCLDELESINYHEDNPVAVDFLLVGNTLALGGLILGDGRPLHGQTAQYTQKLIASGPVRAGLQVDIADFTTPAGGKYQATARYFIYAHNDFIDARVEIRPETAKDECFGAGVRSYQDQKQFLAAANSGILAVWGQQQTIIGEGGLAVIFPPAQFNSWTERNSDEDGYAVFLRPSMAGQTEVEHRLRLVGVWEHGGIANADTFVSHLQDLAARFHQPVTVTKL